MEDFAKECAKDELSTPTFSGVSDSSKFKFTNRCLNKYMGKGAPFDEFVAEYIYPDPNYSRDETKEDQKDGSIMINLQIWQKILPIMTKIKRDNYTKFVEEDINNIKKSIDDYAAAWRIQPEKLRAYLLEKALYSAVSNFDQKRTESLIEADKNESLMAGPAKKSMLRSIFGYFTSFFSRIS